MDKLRFANGSQRTSEIRLNMQKVHTETCTQAKRGRHHWKHYFQELRYMWSNAGTDPLFSCCVLFTKPYRHLLWMKMNPVLPAFPHRPCRPMPQCSAPAPFWRRGASRWTPFTRLWMTSRRSTEVMHRWDCSFCPSLQVMPLYLPWLPLVCELNGANGGGWITTRFYDDDANLVLCGKCDLRYLCNKITKV